MSLRSGELTSCDEHASGSPGYGALNGHDDHEERAGLEVTTQYDQYHPYNIQRWRHHHSILPAKGHDDLAYHKTHGTHGE